MENEVKKSSAVFEILKALIIAVILSLVLVLIAALIIKLFNLSNGAIPILNQIIKVETPKIPKIEVRKEKKLSKNQKLSSVLLYYMMNDTKYIKLYEQELGYIPNEEYLEIANDILAFFLKYNYISIADFITYEISKDNYEKVLDIVDANIKIELKDAEYVGIVNKIKTWIDENKIEELKEKLASVSDINEKLNITNEIAKMKKRMCQNEES